MADAIDLPALPRDSDVVVNRPENPNARPRYRFGRFVLDPATRELIRDGQRLDLAPKVFDGIAYLVANRDRAVGRDELGAAVWGRTDVTDVQLRQLVRKIRRTLDDDGDLQTVVRTVAHFGFHWVAQTQEDAVAELLSARDTPLDTSAAPKRRSTTRFAARPAYFALIVALVAGVAAVAYLSRRGPRPPTEGDTGAVAINGTAAIGVLPIDVVPGRDADADWMRLGLMDLITKRLQRADVPVVSSTDIVALSRGNPSGTALASRVRDATGASRVVASSVTQQPEGWLVQLTLRETDGSERSVKAYAPDAVAATRTASDRLLALLGKQVPAAVTGSGAPSTEELLQRVEAALLVQDLGTARRSIEAAPAALRELPRVQLALARIEIETDQDGAARERLGRLMPTVPVEDDPVLHARVLAALAAADGQDTRAAIGRYSDAIDLLEKSDDAGALAQAYHGRGIAHGVIGDNAGADADFARARVLYTLANDFLGVASVDNNEGVQDARGGRPAEALPLFERAAQVQERFDAVNKLVTSAINLITAHLELLQPAAALAVHERMRPRLAHADSKQSLRFLDYMGAAALIANGRSSDARAQLAQVVRDADPDEESHLLRLVDGLLATLDLSEGRFESATTRATAAVGDARELDVERADAWLTLTRALRRSGHATEASAQAQRFLASAGAAADPPVALRARLAEAEEERSAGRHLPAGRAFEAALEAAERRGTPQDVRAVVDSYGSALLEDGDLARASAVVGRVGRWAGGDFDCAVLQARLYRALGQRDAWQAALETARGLAGERGLPSRVDAAPPH